MKSISILAAACLLLQHAAWAQSDLQNTGIVYLGNANDTLYISGAFTNATTGALTNNGRLYVGRNLSNSQASMAIGTGWLYLNGTTTQTVGGTQPYRTFNLVTNNSAGITLNSNLDVSGAHTFVNGLITTSATPNYLIYQSGATYSGDGDNAHVNGWVKKIGNTTFAFPVGNATYARKVTLQNLSAASEFNVRYLGTTPNTTSLQSPLVSIDPAEYWEINRISGGTAQVNMNWDDGKVMFPEYILGDIRAAWYNGTLWTSQGGTGTGDVNATGSVTSNAVNSFGLFAIGSVSVALPLEFISVTAQRKQDKTLVQWKTAQEKDVDHFDIERSQVNAVFSKIGTMAAANGSGIQQYEFTDATALQGTVLYRIRSIDRDGKTSLSRIVAVSDNTPASIQVLNNPAHGAVYISASAAYKGNYRYELVNAAGQTMQRGTLLIDGVNIVTLPLQNTIVPGMYMLNMHSDTHRLATRIIVK